MNLAYQGNDCRVSGLADGLIRWLSGSTAVGYAVAWALGWMTNEQHFQNRVELTPEQISLLVQAASRTDCDHECLRFLCWTFVSHRTTEVIPALLLYLPRSSGYTRSQIVKTLGTIGGDTVEATIFIYLKDADKSVRRAALGGLANNCKDRADRRLLSNHFSENFGGIDPQDSISENRVTTAARELKLPESEIRQRYERLAERFGLKLEWVPSTGP